MSGRRVCRSLLLNKDCAHVRLRATTQLRHYNSYGDISPIASAQSLRNRRRARLQDGVKSHSTGSPGSAFTFNAQYSSHDSSILPLGPLEDSNVGADAWNGDSLVEVTVNRAGPDDQEPSDDVDRVKVVRQVSWSNDPSPLLDDSENGKAADVAHKILNVSSIDGDSADSRSRKALLTNVASDAFDLFGPQGPGRDNNNHIAAQSRSATEQPGDMKPSYNIRMVIQRTTRSISEPKQDFFSPYKAEASLWPDNPFRPKLPDDNLEDHTEPMSMPAMEPDLDNDDIHHFSEDSTVRWKPQLDASENWQLNGSDREVFPNGFHAAGSTVSAEEVHTFFSDLSQLLENIPNTQAIVRHFESHPWLDRSLADRFGEQESKLLDRAVESVAFYEFRMREYLSIASIQRNRFGTIDMLSLLNRRDLCRPDHWATVLARSAVEMVRHRFRWYGVSHGYKVKSEFALDRKMASLVSLWSKFITAHQGPYATTSHGHQHHGSRPVSNTLVQERLFASVPRWPRGDDPSLDQKIFSAYILMMSLYIRPTMSLADLRDDAGDALASKPKHDPREPLPLTESDDQTREFECTHYSTAIHDIVKGLPQISSNPTMMRLLLAKLSLKGSLAKRVTSDFFRALEAIRRENYSIRADGTTHSLEVAAIELAPWLRSSNPNDSRQVSRWLDDMRTVWPKHLLGRLQTAAFICQAQRGIASRAHRIITTHAEALSTAEFLHVACSATLQREVPPFLVDNFMQVLITVIVPAVESELLRDVSIPVPLFYKHLRALWWRDPFEAFNRMWQWHTLCPVLLKQKDYDWLFRLLHRLYIHPMRAKLRRWPDFTSKAFAVRPARGTKQQICVMALRYALYLQFRQPQQNLDHQHRLVYWLGRLRDAFPSEANEHIKGLSEFILHLGLSSFFGPVSKKNVAELFMAALPYLDEQINETTLDYLRSILEDRQPHLDVEIPSRHERDVFLLHFVDTALGFSELVFDSTRTNKRQVLHALQQLVSDMQQLLQVERNARYTHLIDTLSKDLASLPDYEKLRTLLRRVPSKASTPSAQESSGEMPEQESKSMNAWKPFSPSTRS